MAQAKDKNTGKWYYTGYYKLANGEKKYYKKKGFDTRREARKAEDDFREIVDNPQKYITLEQLQEEFMCYMNKRVKEITVITYKYIFNKVDSYFEKNMFISELNKNNLQTFIDYLDSKYSKEYVEKIYFSLRKMFNYAVENEYILVNPLKQVKVDARKNERKKEIKFWEKTDFDNFIKYVDSEMYRVLFSFLYYMGVRKGELMALQWKDVNLKDKTVRIEKTVSAKTKYKVSTPKSHNSYRTITMPQIVVEEMMRWKERVSVFYGYNNEFYVFGNTRTLASETLRRTLKNYITIANDNLSEDDQLPIITLHGLRHSHASYLINNMSAGFTDFDIAKRLGDTVQMLHSTYAHWFKAGDSGIIEFMNK